ncbi:hypothetical protein Tco_0478959 [Tanacetum coccineum]
MSSMELGVVLDLGCSLCLEKFDFKCVPYREYDIAHQNSYLSLVFIVSENALDTPYRKSCAYGVLVKSDSPDQELIITRDKELARRQKLRFQISNFEAMLKEFLVLILLFPFYFITLMYNREIVQIK